MRTPGITTYIASLIFIAFAVLGIKYGPQLLTAYVPTPAAESQTAAVAATVTEPVSATTSVNHFANVRVNAVAAIVFDVKNQEILYEKNSTEQLPLASITKLMTALAANAVLDPDERITVSEAAFAQDGYGDLEVGDTLTVDELTNLMLVSSSNDGAYALGEAAGRKIQTSQPASTFVRVMNITADEIGLSQTFFRNHTGLDVAEGESGTYGSARDVARLMEYIVKERPALLAATTNDYYKATFENGTTRTVANTNPYANDTIGIIGSKTGYTELAGGNLVIAFDAGLNHPVIVVVLGSTYEGRFDDVTTLVKAVRQTL